MTRSKSTGSKHRDDLGDLALVGDRRQELAAGDPRVSCLQSASVAFVVPSHDIPMVARPASLLPPSAVAGARIDPAPKATD